MLPHMKTLLASASLFLGTALATIPTAPKAVLLENSEVKIARALETYNVPGKFHQHDRNRVMVYLQPGKQRFTYQDGRKPEVFDWKAGEVVWSPADGMHSPLVLDHDFNIIEVELKNKGSDRPITGDNDPVKVDPAHYHLEFENPQVRVLRIKIPPKAVTPVHAFHTDHVLVLLTDQHFLVKDTSGKVQMKERKAGEVSLEKPAEHMVQNVGDEPFEAVSVEIKN